MASCTKCGATLFAKARFCAVCGSPVAAAAGVPSSDAPAQSEKAAPDPFAKTMLGDGAEPPPVTLPTRPVSPMAESVMATREPAARPSQTAPQPPGPSQVPAARPQGAPSGYVGTPWNVAPVAPPPPAARPPPQIPTQYAPPLPGASHAFTPGALVLVYWADGNRYPGTILQVAAHHVFVVFPNGTQQWVDARYVTQSP
jgi:hypothetical protein